MSDAKAFYIGFIEAMIAWRNSPAGFHCVPGGDPRDPWPMRNTDSSCRLLGAISNSHAINVFRDRLKWGGFEVSRDAMIVFGLLRRLMLVCRNDYAGSIFIPRRIWVVHRMICD